MEVVYRSECCDVCSGDHDLKDYHGEIVSILKAAQEIPGYGEVKVRLSVILQTFCSVHS